MDDDDDYPNFGSAFPPQTSTTDMDGQASWNPALRPNGQHRRNESTATTDDFFDRYPGPTPEKSRKHFLGHDLEHSAGPGTDSTSVSPRTMRFSHNDARDGEDDEEDEEAAITYPEETIEQEASERSIPEDGVSLDATAQQAEEAIEKPSAHYEHQGEVTELEEAIDESVEAPLIKDEQPLPTVATIREEPSFENEQEQELQPAKGISRSFTTNFTDVPAPVPANEFAKSVEVSSEWPAVGDDKTFGELLDDDQTVSKPAEKRAAEPPAGDEQDLSAAWAAALDDDEILEDSNELDPTSFFGDDDEDGFLVDEPAPPVQQSRPVQQTRSASAYVPSSSQASNGRFGAPGSAFLDNSHGRSGGTPTTGLYDLYAQPAISAPQTQPSRPALASTQSFVDKPMNGYQSPYDLPMEVVKTRRRPAPVSHQSQVPPRTSSFGVSGSSIEEKALPSPPSSSHGPPIQAAGTSSAPSSTRPTPKSDAGFFADLPMSVKPRPRPNGTSTPQSSGMPTPPLSSSHQQFPNRQNAPAHAPPLRSSQSYAVLSSQSQQPVVAGGLRQPEKAPLFPEQSTPPSTIQGQMAQSTSTPQLSNRYSPAPQAASQPAASSARYSPAPPGQAMKNAQRYSSSPSSIPSLPPPRAAQSFVPRTSSPLAVHGRPQVQSEPSTEQLRNISQLPASPGRQHDLGLVAERRGSGTSRYAPSNASTAADSVSGESGVLSPRRQLTQSPSEFRKLTAFAQPQTSSMLTNSVPAGQAPGKMHLSHKRQFSRELPFASPQDERSQDPLERWKGHPIFYWSAAGMVTSSFPRQTPFYASGVGGPSIKCTPGDVKVTDASSVLPLDDLDAKFPGPLPARSKGKKKDLLAWLTTKVQQMQQSIESSKLNFEIGEKQRRHNDEKLLLWQVMRLYLEHDGVLEGSAKIEQEVRALLIPDLAQKSQVVELQSPTSTTIAGEAVNKTVVHQIQQALFEGQRERAVWLAEEKRLWGHAMLIASTMGPEHFKQVVASFVRSQVKAQGGSESKSLAALYQTFAGSADDCVDELVPPSARAGFQMISATDGRGTADSLSGLDQWRETISLIHSNPTPANSASLVSIGKLLASYGRFEAAHVCYLFGRSLAKPAGADDAEGHFVLLGTDASNNDVDLDSLMLTEIFEYTTSLSAPTTATQYIPHLQAYKLLHARMLAASGHKAQAQSYCEHIDAAIRSTTRPSGYYHQAFAQELMSFNALLSQTPHTGAHGSKFFSRPAIDKVSSNMGSWFTKFVSGGDEGDSDSNASGQGATTESFGPFGGVSGNSGPISRTTSAADLYGGAGAPFAQPLQASSIPNQYTPLAQGSTSKYAPAQYSASRTSFDSDYQVGAQAPYGMPSSEPIRSASSRYAPVTGSQSPALLGVHQSGVSRKASNQSLASTGSYEPKPLLATQDGYGYTPPPVEEAAGIEDATSAEPVTNGYQHDEPTGFDTEGGYAPPTMGYEPPAYQPYQPEPEQEDEAPKSKKKSFMDDDDDDDIAHRAAALKSAPQPATREADPAIVAAAAAEEAARQKKGHNPRESGSWFGVGGWFGKKDPNTIAPGPIKAKLGEQSSFYFDKDLNKWVNKKAGAENATASAPTPPPPRSAPSGVSSSPPSRVASGGGPPTSGPPSRQSTPAAAPSGPGLPSGPAMSGAALGAMAPPPRPSSSMSTASSLDDLLGGPPGAGRKAGGAKNKKKGRYVDVMANAG